VQRYAASERAHVDDASLLSDWTRRELRYRANNYGGVGKPDELLVDLRAKPVLLTAGHSVAQVRDGKRKPPDLRTGGLAELVAAHASASALTAVGSGLGDPNRDREHPFKVAVAELLDEHLFLLDLHGMADRFGLDLCIGSGGAEDSASLELATRCQESAEAAGFRASIDDPFAAREETTITRTAQRLGYVAVQLEITASRRDPARRGKRSAAFARWLIGFVRSLG
jgi:hypothetical protein